MTNILHRFTIDAPPERVNELVATREGVRRWWTGHPVTGEEEVGGQLSVSFRESGEPAATFEVIEHRADTVIWRCCEGPREWINTRIEFAIRPRDDGGTTLLFSHADWAQESEFMSGCSTNWAAYLMSLKSGAEGRGFNPYPGGEMSRWD